MANSQNKTDSIIKIFDFNKMIFTLEDEKIESIFTFKDGDLLIFKGKNSTLYDGKTFLPKCNIDFIGCSHNFYYLSKDEFIFIKYENFEIFKFIDNRKSYKSLQKIEAKIYEQNKKIVKLLNEDILNFVFRHTKNQVRIYRRSSTYIFKEGQEVPSYDLQEQFILEDIDEVYEIDKEKFLSTKFIIYSDELLFKIIENDTYTTLRQKKIKTIKNGKRWIYLIFPFYKLGKNKFLTAGRGNLFIFDLNTLEFETSIKISDSIDNIIIFNNFSFLVVDHLFHIEAEELGNIKENSKYYNKDEYFLKKITIDEYTNEIVSIKNHNITKEMGYYKSFFKIQNYSDNGIAVLIDEKILTIYKINEEQKGELI